MYQITVVYGYLPEADQRRERLVRLIKILEGAPDEVTREFLSDGLERLKRGQKARAVVGAADLASGKLAGDNEVPRTNDQAPEVVLLTPSAADERAIVTPYATPDGLERRLPHLKQLRARDNAAVVLVTKISALPLIVDKLLPLCGFDCRNARFFLAQAPASSEIGEAVVLVTADRDGVSLQPPSASTWFSAEEATDPRKLAARLYPATKSRLHVFAQSQAEGWQSIIGAENWCEE